MAVTSFSKCGRSLRPSAIMEAVKTISQMEGISFAVGNPAPEAFPVDQLKQCYDHVLAQDWGMALQYSPSEGYPPLRELIASWMTQRGVPLSADNILLTAGATQALDMLTRVLLDCGQEAIVDEPMYSGTLHTLSVCGARCIPVPADPDIGLDVAATEQALRTHRPRLMYTVANFHNPLGATIPLEARERLCDLSLRYGVPLIEDDAYGSLYFDNTPPPPPIKAFDKEGMVIYLGSFSKVLAPGIRLGWLAASGELYQRLLWIKQGTDMVTSGLTQMVAYEFCRRGWLDPQLDRIRQMYQSRRDAMISAMQQHFPPGISWSHPKGGMFLWVTLPQGCDMDAILAKAAEEKVIYMPGSAFAVPNDNAPVPESCRRSMRLNFSNAPADLIPEGIARLGRVIRASLQQ
jgi:2-aminoadipate transaminase